MIFRVWAPNAGQMEIELNGRQRLPMDAVDSGWWQVDIDAAGVRTDYAFVVDGNGPFPDPRSPWQPHGVHGASRVVDHDAFTWTDAGWQAWVLCFCRFKGSLPSTECKTAAATGRRIAFIDCQCAGRGAGVQ